MKLYLKLSSVTADRDSQAVSRGPWAYPRCLTHGRLLLPHQGKARALLRLNQGKDLRNLRQLFFSVFKKPLFTNYYWGAANFFCGSGDYFWLFPPSGSGSGAYISSFTSFGSGFWLCLESIFPQTSPRGQKHAAPAPQPCFLSTFHCNVSVKN